MSYSLFFRDNSNSVDVSESTDLDLLIVSSNKKFALIHFENDEVGTANSDPKGSGASISIGGPIGRVGGAVTAVEYGGSFDTVENCILESGPCKIQVLVAGANAKLVGTSIDGTFDSLGGKQLPKAIHKYVKKVEELDGGNFKHIL